MSEPNYGNIYDAQTGSYIRPATRAELIRSIRAQNAPGATLGAFDDEHSGSAVYVGDEDADVSAQIIDWLAANERT